MRRLLQAAAEGHDTVVRQLLALGAPVNVTDERGATALMIAARNGDLGMLQALLSRGADSSVRDSQGQTVFDWAEPSPTTGKYVVAFLLDRGVSREAPRPSAPRPVASGESQPSYARRPSWRAFLRRPVRCGRPSDERTRRCRSSRRCPRSGLPIRRTTTATTLRDM